MTSYHYGPLAEDGHSIRLLRLLPSTHIAAKIECEIFHEEIGRSAQVPYEALSYTWGDPSQTVNIGVSGCAFSATVNLEAALRALRQEHEARVLWVDAVCINQADFQERAAQVRIMWDIYKAAECVVVWLGPRVGDSDVAMENMASNDCQKKQAIGEALFGRQSTNGCGCPVAQFHTAPSRIGVLDLLGSHWFTRVWVLQEVAAAKRVVVVCGDKLVEGKDFYAEIVALSSSFPSLKKALRRSRPVVELMGQSISDLSICSLPLLELIETFRSWDATKLVDKVFALLSFSSDASCAPELQPDYLAPAPVVARRIVQFAFPSCVIDTQLGDGTEVVFEIEGLPLGKIVFKTTGTDVREYGFYARDSEIPGVATNPKVADLFSLESRWIIQINNERRLFGHQNIVMLLRGATRPAVVSFRDGKYTIVMLATPEPRKATGSPSEQESPWTCALNPLSAETEGIIKLKLTWDPFRKPHPSEVSQTTPTPNDPAIQWEAMKESIKDRFDNDPTLGEQHVCFDFTRLRMMHDKDKEAIKAGTSKFTTTLHQAAYYGWYGTTKLLLAAGAQVDETIGEDSFTTPLHLAAHGGHLEVARALLAAGCLVNPLDDDGHTPFDVAFLQDHEEMEQLLFEAGGEPVMPASEYKRIAAERRLASSSGRPAAITDGQVDGITHGQPSGSDSCGIDPNTTRGLHVVVVWR